MHSIDVAWRVEGASQVDVDEATLREAVASGIDLDDGGDLFEFLNLKSGGRLLRSLPDDWYEKDRPELIQADFQPPNWYYEEQE